MLNKYLVFHICKYTGNWMALSTSSSKHILNFVYTSTLIQSNDSCFKVAVSMQGYSKPKSFVVVLRPFVCWCSYINLFVFSMDNSKDVWREAAFCGVGAVQWSTSWKQGLSLVSIRRTAHNANWWFSCIFTLHRPAGNSYAQTAKHPSIWKSPMICKTSNSWNQ